MSFRIGPSYCGECGEDYGHSDTCSKSYERPENWPVSRKLKELANAPATVSSKDRLTRLIEIVTELAEQVERN